MNSKNCTETSVIKGLTSRNTNQAIKCLYQMGFPLIQKLIFRYNGSAQDAEDIFQDTVTVFYENVLNGKYDPSRARIGTYLYGIARNLWLKEKRNMKHYSSTDISEIEHLPDEEETKINEEDYVEKFDTVLKCLSKMGDPCMTILKGMYFYKKTQTELAEELGFKNANTIKATKERCMKKLRSLVYA